MPRYDFSQLSPFDFEMLVAGLLQKEWGCRLEAFKSGRDQGIDLRYAHLFTDKKIIVQCKHYVKSGFSTLLSHLKQEENLKFEVLSPARYVLVTD
jgi:restriction endonuclease